MSGLAKSERLFETLRQYQNDFAALKRFFDPYCKQYAKEMVGKKESDSAAAYDIQSRAINALIQQAELLGLSQSLKQKRDQLYHLACELGVCDTFKVYIARVLPSFKQALQTLQYARLQTDVHDRDRLLLGVIHLRPLTDKFQHMLDTLAFSADVLQWLLGKIETEFDGLRIPAALFDKATWKTFIIAQAQEESLPERAQGLFSARIGGQVQHLFPIIVDTLKEHIEAVVQRSFRDKLLREQHVFAIPTEDVLWRNWLIDNIDVMVQSRFIPALTLADKRLILASLSEDIAIVRDQQRAIVLEQFLAAAEENIMTLLYEASKEELAHCLFDEKNFHEFLSDKMTEFSTREGVALILKDVSMEMNEADRAHSIQALLERDLLGNVCRGRWLDIKPFYMQKLIGWLAPHTLVIINELQRAGKMTTDWEHNRVTLREAYEALCQRDPQVKGWYAVLASEEDRACLLDSLLDYVRFMIKVLHGGKLLKGMPQMACLGDVPGDPAFVPVFSAKTSKIGSSTEFSNA